MNQRGEKESAPRRRNPREQRELRRSDRHPFSYRDCNSCHQKPACIQSAIRAIITLERPRSGQLPAYCSSSTFKTGYVALGLSCILIPEFPLIGSVSTTKFPITRELLAGVPSTVNASLYEPKLWA